MNLRDIFDLTGRQFDLAEAHWELQRATDHVVEMHPQAKMALALSGGHIIDWADGPGAPIVAMASIGIVYVVERGKGDALRAWEYLKRSETYRAR